MCHVLYQVKFMGFSMTLDRDEDGIWIVECPNIPGCVSQGQTRQEAFENIKVKTLRVQS
jgi:predicted RNase H-like HicB family nuclease